MRRNSDSQTTPYPTWICSDCGNKHGNRKCGVATWHVDRCCICGETKEVTEPRDFGHLKEGTQHRKTS